ncbi:MAG: carbamoyl-phosphate synthase large subunit [Deltaproteobacteria bacterium]|nr:carbamoyl-phosphate synthase large subunit [Deltaproteobacteria bacterium]
MPKRTDLKRIMVLGSGPIVIGQACEFDYSGTQAVKALKSEGFEVVLVNSNPATIMTDPELADRTYIEPLSAEYLEAIIAREQPDAILPTVGGQTALNLALELVEDGTLEKYKVELIGASSESIRIAEDRQLFRDAMVEIGLDVPVSELVNSTTDALKFSEDIGYPVVIRPSFTLGGSGGGIAYNAEECERIVRHGLDLSPVHQVLIEESLLGWKEFELEVMRDRNDNFVVICSIENFDPMGVHTGDSLTVAPAQTLTDREYQRMRDAAAAIMRKVKVDTGGSNVQFAVHPETGRLAVIEMNPRVSRSSALASKATGFPIAKIAAKLAIGYSLDEISNDITQKTPAAFEPSIDYVVTKIPKFAFEKFPGVDITLGTQMKSVGEVMAIGRTFKESLFKALRSLESVRAWEPPRLTLHEFARSFKQPNEYRVRLLMSALEAGFGIDELHRLTRIDKWFLDQLEQCSLLQQKMRGKPLASISSDTLRNAKEYGFSDRRVAHLCNASIAEVRQRRYRENMRPVYKLVDTCAAEFESYTPYMYSTYEEENESSPTKNRRVVILGSGPNRIGQGIEFDYCCCHASLALRDMGITSIMINSNPETVSTDYDTSDRLYFEPLTLEDVLEVVACEKPEGVIVQFGGQTPINMTQALANEGVKVLGTPADAVHLASDRERFSKLLRELGLRYPAHGFAKSAEEAHVIADKLGYSLLVRPSFVLGGRAMAIVDNREDLAKFVEEALHAAPEGSILIDKFIDDAIEVDVDALCDGEDCIVAGIMQHIEQAGVHSGDSSCVLPPYQISKELIDEIKSTTRILAKALGIVGLMNVQYAIDINDKLFIIEVNPRASRTVPFVSKATGIPCAKIATHLMMGEKLKDLGITRDLEVPRVCVKTPVFPFIKFPGFDPKLTPEMRSTGEVMGIANDIGHAYYKAQLGANTRLPRKGTAFITVNERDHKNVVGIAKRLSAVGFELVATRGTAKVLREHEIEVREILKVSEGRPNCVDAIKSAQISLIINTPLGVSSFQDGWAIRTAAVQHNVPCITTLAGAAAATLAIESMADEIEVKSLQELHAR